MLCLARPACTTSIIHEIGVSVTLHNRIQLHLGRTPSRHSARKLGMALRPSPNRLGCCHMRSTNKQPASLRLEQGVAGYPGHGRPGRRARASAIHVVARLVDAGAVLVVHQD